MKASTPNKLYLKPRRVLIVSLIILGAVAAIFMLDGGGISSAKSIKEQPQANLYKSYTPKGSLTNPSTSFQSHLGALSLPPAQSCSDNTTQQNIIVSISDRHLWACSGRVVSYESPVITGMSFLAADLTPTGVFHIYGKQTDLYLKGADSTGSWNDYVNYWMPFLSNQYGVYGFHDATWRTDDEFGNVSPSSKNASHGCVELPLATAAWLYNWANVGTTVTIVS